VTLPLGSGNENEAAGSMIGERRRAELPRMKVHAGAKWLRAIMKWLAAILI